MKTKKEKYYDYILNDLETKTTINDGRVDLPFYGEVWISRVDEIFVDNDPSNEEVPGIFLSYTQQKYGASYEDCEFLWGEYVYKLDDLINTNE